jgi:hypothetical protein
VVAPVNSGQSAEFAQHVGNVEGDLEGEE